MKFFKKKQKDKSGNKNAAVAAAKARSKQDSLLENAHMEEPVIVSKSIEGEGLAQSKSGATVEETFQDEIESESPSKGIKARAAVLLVSAKTTLASLLAAFQNMSAKGKYALAAGLLACLSISVVVAVANKVRTKDLNVAFIGNSYFFVNDLPRLMESMSDGHIYQDSCLHGRGSLLNILRTGNGMYPRWETEYASISPYGKYYEHELYDYGACSVPELLLGEDSLLSYGNEDGAFADDGKNPCFEDDAYLAYRSALGVNGSVSWDYVVLTDQAKRMCFDDARQDAITALNYTYAPILKGIRATPIIVQPQAFYSENTNMTGLGDIPTFTSKVMEGAKDYMDFLNAKLPRRHRAKIAPVGDAFLAVWEDKTAIWKKLFLEDGVHSSGYGSYLYGAVIYATIYGKMPKAGIVITGDVSELFDNARKLQANSTQFPTKAEAKYLYKIAKKVAVHGYRPKSYATVGKSPSSYSDNFDAYSDNGDEDNDEDEDEDYDDDDQQ